MKSARDFFDYLVASSASELFQAYGINVTRRAATAASEAPEACSGGVLAFSSDAMAGSILLVGSFDFLAANRPAEARRHPLAISSSADWLVVRDWSMELVNQLFGRIRNKAYAHNVRLNARTPSAVSGDALAVAIRMRTSTPYEFAAPDGRAIRVWMDATVSPSFSFAPSPQPPSVPPIKEGGTVIF
jgi:hypothetical protein